MGMSLFGKLGVFTPKRKRRQTRLQPLFLPATKSLQPEHTQRRARQGTRLTVVLCGEVNHGVQGTRASHDPFNPVPGLWARSNHLRDSRRRAITTNETPLGLTLCLVSILPNAGRGDLLQPKRATRYASERHRRRYSPGTSREQTRTTPRCLAPR